ncbi:ATP-dependent DNA helicase PIF1-like protein [Cladobotryum mycophilum]|uniref:ATP-dependent DNA helicase n=1 Tax=Cladobotryum mycophilum TaxID=491253 RepID=A0ABR0SZS2_9HYPO
MQRLASQSASWPSRGQGAARVAWSGWGLSQRDLSYPNITAPTTTRGALVEQESLSAEQEELIELILTGRNVFYTGAAGTGKSTVLRAAVNRLRRRGQRVEVVAPTGRAALAVNGITTWSYAGWSPPAHATPLETLRKWAISEKNVHRFAETDVLVIDEISMVENHHLERLNEVMKEARGHAAWNLGFKHVEKIRNSAFGGCQVIVTGDFFQLPPVLPFQHCIQCGSPLLRELRPGETTHRCPSGHGNWPNSYKWAFQSDAWESANFSHVELKQIYRQAEDPLFIEILNRFRSGEFTYDDIMVLADPNRDTHTTGNTTRLYPTRSEVAQHNADKLRKLESQPFDFITQDSFYWNEASHPHLQRHGERQADGTLTALKEDRYESYLRLKVGMPVVLLSNINIGKGLVNGSQGVIVAFDSVDRIDLVRRSKSMSKRYYEGSFAEDEFYKYAKAVQHDQIPLPVVRFDNGVETTIYPECSMHEMGNETLTDHTDLDTYGGDMDEFLQRPPPSVLCRTQIPLIAGWAMSIHKAQGTTLGKVIVDLTRAFAEGQVYVALSRAKNLSGLKIEGDPRGLLRILSGEVYW